MEDLHTDIRSPLTQTWNGGVWSSAQIRIRLLNHTRYTLLPGEDMADPDETVPMQSKSTEVEEVEFMPGESLETNSPKNDRIRIAMSLIAVVVLVGVAFAVGYIVRLVLFKCGPEDEGKTLDLTAKLVKEAFDSISSSRIESQLRYFTKIPHIAGSQESYDQALYMQKEWLKYGVDSAELKKYNVLLSYPTRPGLASILNTNGSEMFRASQREKSLNKDEEKPNVLPPFHAYSPSGQVTGRLVFVNYARVEDFKMLKTMGVPVAGHIAIAKYGAIFRGDKVKFASEAGAIGLLLYSDPDSSPEGPGKVYPDAYWLPPTGVQRGSVYLEDGDAVTLGYPAVDGAYASPTKDAGFPKIPSYPISSQDAEHFLKLLTIKEAPKEWKGGLQMTYYTMMDPNDERNVSLDVEMSLETKPVYDVVGIIRGSVEPDRLVMFGNHRDAWVFGAADPSSGTASLMELVRVFGELKANRNWRPRRTIVFLSWGAEEPGVLGSTEWAEEFSNLLSYRAVAYLNVDIAVQGNYSLRLKSSPLMDYAVFDVAKKVYTPSGESVFNDWKSKFPDKSNRDWPQVLKVGSGSDYAALYNRLGVPSLDLRYTFDTNKWDFKGSYPMYHSVHDSFHWMKTFVDRDFQYHRTMTQLWMQIGTALADSTLIPFNCSRYAEKLSQYTRDLKSSYGAVLAGQKISLEPLDAVIKSFTASAKSFHEHLESINLKDPLAVRMANDRLVQFEKSFINPEGLPGRPYKRHVVFAPSAHNLYLGVSFPGLFDALYEAQDLGKGDWVQVNRQLEFVVHHIRMVGNLMSINTV
ncbi:N-acetylated-alpha-linked acidic dipeptidase 2 [Nematostella vectensis]|uniref:N-acetylated-alpha-linked acidic dipeptidase 2 n=1 Tax=Nematostella vectensis TaxID=45351 RepID=UPI002076F7E5|nr:N-acetylated-alpha-linked acidic dipeptidase 2 [Nematostella vectensis]